MKRIKVFVVVRPEYPADDPVDVFGDAEGLRGWLEKNGTYVVDGLNKFHLGDRNVSLDELVSLVSTNPDGVDSVVVYDVEDSERVALLVSSHWVG